MLFHISFNAEPEPNPNQQDYKTDNPNNLSKEYSTVF